MGDSISVIFATILAGIMMFLFPMMDTWERQDDLSYVSAYTAVANTVDAVRNTGRITMDMYDELLSTINATGNRFDIKMEHRKVTYIYDEVDGGTRAVYEYYYTNDIMKELKGSDRAYTNFKVGDFFYISVKNTNVTQATVFKENLYGANLETFKIGVPYGGQIRNEYGR